MGTSGQTPYSSRDKSLFDSLLDHHGSEKTAIVVCGGGGRSCLQRGLSACDYRQRGGQELRPSLAA